VTQGGAPDAPAILRPEQFLMELFGAELPAGSRIVVWSTKEIRWCSSPHEAATTMRELDGPSAVDIYFGCSLQRADAMRSNEHGKAISRGDVATATAIGGVWVDIDVAGPGHKKKNLPPTMKDARGVVDALPVQPTIILETGGGIHAWWLLREPFLIETEDDRKRASNAVLGWQGLIRGMLGARGWKMDSTHDLARVLRAPGLKNRKYGVDAKAVFVDLDRRFNLDDFSEWATAEVTTSPSVTHVAVDTAGLRLDPAAEPPFEKFNDTANVNARFLETYNGQRKDLPSASERDLSLAGMAARTGWTDQEIVNLLIASRRKHKDDLKLRLDYYARTLARARQESAADTAFDRIADTSSEPPPAPGSDEQRSAIADITSLLGLQIIRIIKYRGDPPDYRLVLREGAIFLGKIDAIAQAHVFRNRVADVTRRFIPRMKPDRWDVVAQAILRACEEVDIGPESSSERSVEALLQEYLSRYRPGRDRDQACAQRLPFIYENAILVSCEHLKQFVVLSEGDKTTKREIAKRLRMHGAESRTVGWTKPNGAYTTSYLFELPASSWVEQVISSVPNSVRDRQPGEDG